MKTRVTFLVTLLLFTMSSCRLPDSIGFYQPVTMNLEVPDGPPEYKAGWYAGCRSVLKNKTFANAFVYLNNKGPEFGSGVYQHDAAYQTGWGQGFFACHTHVTDFVREEFRSFKYGPLE